MVAAAKERAWGGVLMFSAGDPARTYLIYG
jgi:hypothetical protein